MSWNWTWTSVDDELPAENTQVLVTNSYGDVAIADLRIIGGEQSWRGHKVTHWMPLPYPANDESWKNNSDTATNYQDMEPGP